MPTEFMGPRSSQARAYTMVMGTTALAERRVAGRGAIDG